LAGHSIPRTLFYERADVLYDILMKQGNNVEGVYYADSMIKQNSFWLGNGLVK